MKLSKKMQKILGTILLILAVIIWAGEQFGLFGTDTGSEIPPAPQSTSAAPATTTKAPATTTKAPATTTKAPTTTTKAPVTTTKAPATTTKTPEDTTKAYVHYYFRNDNLLTQHFEKHGEPEMGFKNKKDYEEAACRVINNPEALHKTEKEDGDFVFYIEKTNEFVVLSKDGYIRTYFLPGGGINYYNRQ